MSFIKSTASSFLVSFFLDISAFLMLKNWLISSAVLFAWQPFNAWSDHRRPNRRNYTTSCLIRLCISTFRNGHWYHKFPFNENCNKQFKILMFMLLNVYKIIRRYSGYCCGEDSTACLSTATWSNDQFLFIFSNGTNRLMTVIAESTLIRLRTGRLGESELDSL
jgi:hypothetical protein